MPYTSQTSNRIGGIFVLADGSQHVIPNSFLTHANLAKAALLRLHYSFVTVEIAGERLGAIFHDVTIGKLGTVTVDAEDAAMSKSDPAITTIVFFPETPSAASERERSNA
jgi:hypothetical protein